jgi:hypothetical protein
MILLLRYYSKIDVIKNQAGFRITPLLLSCQQNFFEFSEFSP